MSWDEDDAWVLASRLTGTLGSTVLLAPDHDQHFEPARPRPRRMAGACIGLFIVAPGKGGPLQPLPPEEKQEDQHQDEQEPQQEAPPAIAPAPAPMIFAASGACDDDGWPVRLADDEDRAARRVPLRGDGVGTVAIVDRIAGDRRPGAARQGQAIAAAGADEIAVLIGRRDNDRSGRGTVRRGAGLMGIDARSGNLHSVWDDALGRAKDAASAITAAAALTNVPPALTGDADPAIWLSESSRFAQSVAYGLPIGNGAGPFTLDAAYHSGVTSTAKERVSLAGARLGRLINAAHVTVRGDPKSRVCHV